MSERKVLNKYFPPDFDPAKIPRKKRPKNFQYTVRLMAPFSMQCNTCGNWIPKSTKFNARKETVHGEDYLGIRIFRFYIRCPRCSTEITFKTDPKNTDYICEQGASRNFEASRAESRETERLVEKRAEEEANNPMKALENRTVDSKREMDILDALDEIRTRNAAQERVDSDRVLAEMADRKEEEIRRLKMLEDDEIERQAKEAFSGRRRGGGGFGVGSSEEGVKYDVDAATGERVRRINDDEELESVDDDGTYDQMPGYDRSADAEEEDAEEERHLLALKNKYGSVHAGMGSSGSGGVSATVPGSTPPTANLPVGAPGAVASFTSTLGIKRKADIGADLGIVVKKKLSSTVRENGNATQGVSKEASGGSALSAKPANGVGGLSALGMYGDDDDESGQED
ncbi:hypothetical protein HDU93_009755 [Gonapodya sp. JEL0774]|nr:hypothetical protein HDU93_009755 [Gonapodya sp. JEL0774]